MYMLSWRRVVNYGNGWWSAGRGVWYSEMLYCTVPYYDDDVCKNEYLRRNSIRYKRTRVPHNVSVCIATLFPSYVRYVGYDRRYRRYVR